MGLKVSLAVERAASALPSGGGNCNSIVILEKLDKF